MFKRKNANQVRGSGNSEDEGGSRNIWRDDNLTSTYSIYITGGINDENYHNERIDLIRTAKDGDVIYIYITTPGGIIDIAEGYCDAIKTTQAQVITRAVGMVASAGTLIWLAGHEKEIADRSAFMFHNAQVGSDYADAKNMAGMADFYSRFYEDNFRSVYENILTPEELDLVFSGREVYIRGTDMLRRIDSMGSEEKQEDAHKLVSPSEIRVITGDFQKDINLSTISTTDFAELSIGELKGVMENMGAPEHLYLGLRTWYTVAENLVDFIKLQVDNGG